MRTFIRRPGNKSSHLKHIIPLLPKTYNVYIEPFLGTGAVFLHIIGGTKFNNFVPQWIINDLNTDIISIWELVRDSPNYIITEINKFREKFLKLSSNEEKLLFCKNIAKN